MKARAAALGELEPDTVRQWRRLADRAIEPNAFLDPRFLVPSGHHRDDAKSTQLILVEDGSELLGVMAFAVVPRKIRGLPVRAVTPRIPLLSEESERWYPLIDPKRPAETLEAMLRGFRHLGLPSYLDLDCFPADGALNDALFLAAEAAHVPIVERGSEEFAYLYCPSTDETAIQADGASALLSLDGLSQHSRRNYGRLLRGLERTVGGELSIEDRGDDPAAIDEFLDLQAAGWKGDASARGGFAFRTSGNDQWFTDVASQFREDNLLSVFELKHETTTVYMGVTLRSGGRRFGMQDAFNESFSKYRVGTLGRLAMMRYFLREPKAQEFDPDMNPRYADSTRIYPHRRRFASYLLAPRGMFPKSVVGALPIIRRARDRLKRT